MLVIQCAYMLLVCILERSFERSCVCFIQCASAFLCDCVSASLRVLLVCLCLLLCVHVLMPICVLLLCACPGASLVCAI